MTLDFNGEKFFSESGLKDLLEDQSNEKDLLYSIIHLKGEDIEIAITHSKTQYSEEYHSFVNGQHTTQGGTHQAAFREGLTREEIPITTLEDVEINRWADESSKLVANFVGKKNATRFNALVKKILRSDEIKDARKFLTYILAPADNFLRQVNPELARTLYSQSQSLEASGYFNVHALVQNQYTNDFYKIFNIFYKPIEPFRF